MTIRRFPSRNSPEPMKIFEAPHTDTQKRLCKIWEDLLGIENPGINGNFFYLGGNSLKVVQLALRVNSEFEKDLSAEDLFTSKTVKEQADLLDGAARGSSLKIERTADMPDYPVLNAQRENGPGRSNRGPRHRV